MQMRISWTGWAFVGLLGCAEESVCERAADKLNACHIGDKVAEQGYARVPLAIDPDDCSGQNECLAKCVDAASCADLESVIVSSGTDPNSPPATGNGKLFACIAACVQ